MHRYTWRAVLVLAALMCAAAPQAQSAAGSAVASASAADIAAKTDELVAAHQKMNLFSGAVLIARGGQVLVSKGYGMANYELNVPNTPQTKFRLGSITKQFTAVAVLLLQERGRLTVQDPICRHFDPCPAAWQPVSIHHLLTHTSGIPSYTGSPDYQRNMRVRYSPDELIASFRDKPLEFEPGAQYRYNNSGYFLLGRLIERVSGQSYETFLHASIFEPLGMHNSGYDRTEVLLPQRASGYSRRTIASSREGQPGHVLVNADYLDMSQPYAAGSLYSTAEDLYIWDRALAAGRLLSPASYKAMWTPFRGNYAYGWSVDQRWNRTVVGHGGGINGFSTMIARYPEDDLCVIVLGNVANANAGSVSRGLEAIALGQPYDIPRERVAIKVDPAIYDAYVGVYELRPGVTMTITRDGDRLMTQLTGQPMLELFPESETKFFLRAVDAQLTFVRDAAGKVTQAVLHQNGVDQTARRIR